MKTGLFNFDEFIALAPEDGVPGLGGFADDDADFAEVIVLKPGEEPESDEDDDDDKVVMTKAEYDQLSKKTDSSSALLEGINGLQKVLSTPQAPLNVQQQAGESDEEFEKRLEQELFKEGASGKAIRNAVERYSKGTNSQLMGYLSQQNKRILELDPNSGSVFNRYKGEIEEFVSRLSPEQQIHPQVWDYALKQVREAHSDELMNETVEDQVSRRVKEELEKLGISGDGDDGGKVKARPQHLSSGRSTVGSGANGGGKKRRVFATQEDKERAMVSGLPLEQYLRKIGKL